TGGGDNGEEEVSTFDPLDLDAEMMKETDSKSSQSALTSMSKPLDQQQQQEVNIPVASFANRRQVVKLPELDLLNGNFLFNGGWGLLIINFPH
ncbi:hypothetical protein M8C21_006915, partial [Ambrosia artemisiifolia]